MSVERVTAALVRCDQTGEHGRRQAVLYAHDGADHDAVRAFAAERGWGVDNGETCPRHRGPTP